MQTFLQFLRRFAVFFLFILLELVCFYLIVQNNRFQRTRFVSSAGYLSAGLLDTKSKVIDYFYLQETNEQLVNEQQELLTKLFNQKPVEPDSCAIVDQVPVDTISITEDSFFINPQYRFVPAKVISKSTSRQQNYFTINKGSLQGIEPDMGVVSGSGVVGLITSVSDNYAVVMTVLHRKLKISAKIDRNNYFGSLSWNGADIFTAQLDDIPINVLVREGDQVITSGYSAFFPEKMPIGKIKEVSTTAGSNFQNIQVDLATVFGEIEYVFVINNRDNEILNQLKENLEYE